MLIRKILTTYNRREDGASLFNRLFANLVAPISHVLRFDTWYRLYHRVLSMYTPFTNYIGLVTHSNAFMRKYVITKHEFENSRTMEFEGFKVRAPQDYDSILSRMYGDYMSFPPLEARGNWHHGAIMFDPEHSYRELLDGHAC